MKQTKLTFVAALLLTAFAAGAQSIKDGVTDFYAQRYKSAKSVFEGLLASNPNNLEATYWLGQTLIENEEVPAARALYEKVLMANGDAPLVLVGMGHVELYENKKNEARQRFESALSLSRSRKGDDPDILKAVARANIDAKAGDVAYAIEKLKAADERDSKNKDPEIYYLLGDAYRKAHEGGNAVINYDKALEADKTFAVAAFRKAKLYETQQNWEIYLQDLNDAISRDPKFAPAYYEMYYYYLYRQQFTEADDNAKKFLANTDADIQNDYLVAQTCWAKKDFDCAIRTLNNIISQAGPQTKPRTYKLMAYSYVDKGDTAAAKQYVEQYFAKAKEEDVVPPDYILKGEVEAYNTGNQALAFAGFKKAVQLDTLVENQNKFLDQAKNYFKVRGDKVGEADVDILTYQIKKREDIAYLFNTGVTLYQGGAYDRADSIFKAYSKVYPDSVYGYLWSAYTNMAIDTSGELGLAVPPFEKLLNLCLRDTVKNKENGLKAAPYLTQYYANVKKDYDSAVYYISQALKFDPENETFKKNLEILKRVADQNRRAAGGTKTPGKLPKPVAMAAPPHSDKA